MRMPQELIDQLVDPADARLSAGSNITVQWRCRTDPRHVWSASPNTRRRSPGCPVCMNKLVLPGVNDLATTHPDLAAELVEPAQARAVCAGSHKKLLWCCSDPGHRSWEAKPVTRTRNGSGCPQCAGRTAVPGVDDLATTHPALAAELVEPSLATQLKAGSGKKVAWRCSQDPTHVWEATVSNRAGRGSGCPSCLARAVHTGIDDLATTHPDLAAELVDSSLAAGLKAGSNVRCAWLCPVCGHTWNAVVSQRASGTGCPRCAGRVRRPGVNDLATTHPDLAAQLIDPATADVVGHGSHLRAEWVCPRGHTWSARIKDRALHGTNCPVCSLAGTSRAEAELADAVRALVPGRTVLTRDRSILPGRQELDIVLPEQKVAIEYNGIFWHSETAGRGRHDHAAKTRAAKGAGYQLIHIWEDDWLDRRHQVLRALAHRLHALDRLAEVIDDPDPMLSQTIPARALRPCRVEPAQARAFLDEHHIQGAVTASVHLGLRDHQDRLRAVLSLRSPRNNARTRRPDGHWEIQRYATAGRVVAGFSRLLTHAERLLREEGLELARWVSFSDDSISDGGMYAASGFTREGIQRPDYRYAGASTRWRRRPKEAYQRRRFRQDPDLLWQEGWTERQAAEANGLVHVWDAGKTRWVKDV